MHCAQARNLIALLVGDDLGDSDRPEVERHLSQCNSCHGYHADLAGTHLQLQSLSSEDSGVSSPSLWPEMQSAVRLANADRGSRRFNGWVAGLAIAATVMAMFAISGDLGPIRNQGVNFNTLDLAPRASWPADIENDQRPSADVEETPEEMKRQKFKFKPQ